MGGGVKAEVKLGISYSDTMLNYRLSQKLKLLGNGKFNHSTISLTLPLTCGLKLPLNKWGPNKWEFNILNES